MKYGYLKFNLFPWEAGSSFATEEDAVKALEKEGWVSRTKDKEKEFIKNATTVAVDDAVKTTTKKFLDGWDTDVEKITGVKKEDGVKTSDYLKSSFTNLVKDKKEALDAVEKAKNERLSDVDAVKEVKLQFDTYKKQAKTDLQEKEDALKAMKGNEFKNSIKAQVSEAMGRIRPKLASVKDQAGKVDASMQEELIEAKLGRFYANNVAKQHEGNIIYHNASDDTAVIDKEGNHLSTYSILETMFDGMVDKQHKAAGAGGQNRKPGDGNGDDFKLTLPPEVTTKMNLMDHILGTEFKGVKLDQANQEHAAIINKLYQENGKELPLR